MLKMTKTKRLSYVTMLSALSIVINLFESWFIPPVQFGIRFGLANIISLITIELFGIKELLIVNATIQKTNANIVDNTTTETNIDK